MSDLNVTATGIKIDNSVWYTAIDGQQEGPFSSEQLVASLRGKPLDAGRLVWRPGMGEWVPVLTTELRTLLFNSTSPPPLAAANSLEMKLPGWVKKHTLMGGGFAIAVFVFAVLLDLASGDSSRREAAQKITNYLSEPQNAITSSLAVGVDVVVDSLEPFARERAKYQKLTDVINMSDSEYAKFKAENGNDSNRIMNQHEIHVESAEKLRALIQAGDIGPLAIRVEPRTSRQLGSIYIAGTVSEALRPLCLNYQVGHTSCQYVAGVRRLKEINITGMRRVNERGTDFNIVEFEVPVDVTDMGRRFSTDVPNKMSYKAVFVKYDDGWRLFANPARQGVW